MMKGETMRPETNHASEANAQTRLWTYERIIKRYVRYTMIRCTCYTNEKPGAQRITFYALVTACLPGDERARPKISGG